MKKLLSAGAALALSAIAVLALPATANALTYTSLLEYRDGLTGPQTPYGTVTVQELNPNTVKVTVTLTNSASLFVNTGGPHDPFLFSTVASDTVTTQNTGAQDFFDGGRGAFNATPFGTFTNKIGCCLVHGGKKDGQEGNGQTNGDPPPLIFTLSNSAGLTFAGVGATFDSAGKLLTTGTGDRFLSNAGGFWFAADIYDGATGRTYNVAAKDAFVDRTRTGVPEPGTWALMLVGFGGAGAMLRSRRRLQRAAA